MPVLEVVLVVFAFAGLVAAFARTGAAQARAVDEVRARSERMRRDWADAAGEGAAEEAGDP